MRPGGSGRCLIGLIFGLQCHDVGGSLYIQADSVSPVPDGGTAGSEPGAQASGFRSDGRMTPRRRLGIGLGRVRSATERQSTSRMRRPKEAALHFGKHVLLNADLTGRWKGAQHMKLGKALLGAVIGFGGITFVGSTRTEGAPQGRLLLAGPHGESGPSFDNEIHEFCLETGGRKTFASFPSASYAMAVCPDGRLYVVDQTTVYKFDRLTGQVLSSFPMQTGQPHSMVCKPDGNLLIRGSAAQDTIDQYTPAGVRTTWLSDGGLNEVSALTVTPNGNIAFRNLHPGFGANELREYDANGTFVRMAIPTSGGFHMDGFAFRSAGEILVTERNSECIKRFDWTTTPATTLPDFVCDSSRLGPAYIGIHPSDGSVFVPDYESGCVHGWDSSGQLLYGGQPLGCYASPTYMSPPLILAEPSNVCIPTLSEWGLIAMGTLVVLAGAVVAKRRRAAA